MGTIVNILVSIACITLGCMAVIAINLYACRISSMTFKPLFRDRITQSLRSVAAASASLPMVSRNCLQAIGKTCGLAAATLRGAMSSALKRIPWLQRKPSDSAADFNLYKPIDMNVLNSRVRTSREIYGDAWRLVLLIDLCGTIEAPDDDCEIRLEITLGDAAESQPAMTRSKQGLAQAGCPFVYQTEMGKLCHRTTLLEEWTTVAKVCPDSFVLPRQGQRNLQCDVVVLLKATGRRLAAATCIAAYENAETGYLDIEDKVQWAKTLAVGLAFSVGAADGDLLDTEIEVIHGWVKSNFDSANASASVRSQLQRAFRKTAAFFRHGGRLNVERVCHEIVEIAPMVGRRDTLDLCLRVAAARGQVTESQMTLLKNLADSLGIERGRLRAMAEKTLPVNMHQVQDSEIVLGVTTAMSRDQARQQLNHEYAKWSSRVISSDPAIQKQADQMLQLIADARAQFVGVRPAKSARLNPARSWSLIEPTRIMKNSSRLELKMLRNFRRSRSGTCGSRASSSTRALNSSQVNSRLMKCSLRRSWATSTLRNLRRGFPPPIRMGMHVLSDRHRTDYGGASANYE